LAADDLRANEVTASLPAADTARSTSPWSWRYRANAARLGFIRRLCGWQIARETVAAIR